jgi:hypothetical protein
MTIWACLSKKVGQCSKGGNEMKIAVALLALVFAVAMSAAPTGGANVKSVGQDGKAFTCAYNVGQKLAEDDDSGDQLVKKDHHNDHHDHHDHHDDCWYTWEWDHHHHWEKVWHCR